MSTRVPLGPRFRSSETNPNANVAARAAIDETISPEPISGIKKIVAIDSGWMALATKPEIGPAFAQIKSKTEIIERMGASKGTGVWGLRASRRTKSPEISPAEIEKSVTPAAPSAARNR